MIAQQRFQGPGEPDIIRSVVIDKVTSILTSNAITAALFVRESTGRGQRVNVPMMDAALYFAWPEGLADFTFVGEQEDGSRLAKTHTLTKISDGYIVQLAINHKQRLALLDAVGHPDLRSDPRLATPDAMVRPANLADLREIIATAALEVTSDELLQSLLDAGVAAGPVLEPAEVPDDPHVRAEQLLAECHDPVIGHVRQARPPFHFEESHLEPASPCTHWAWTGPTSCARPGTPTPRSPISSRGGVLNPGPAGESPSPPEHT